jgi:hypothetical protein
MLAMCLLPVNGEDMPKSYVVALLSLLAMGGCPPESGPSASTPPPKAAAASSPRPIGTLPNCEAKDNTNGPCDLEETAVPSEERKPLQSANPVPAQKDYADFNPNLCGTGPQMVIPILAISAQGRIEELQNYCTSIGMGDPNAPDGQTSPTRIEAGGGCVWKGRTYAVGDRISDVRDGPIRAGDLYVHGTRFDIVSDLGRGPGERFQACECGRSAGVWGCV